MRCRRTTSGRMLRTATREDEWLLLLHGAVLGLGRRAPARGSVRMTSKRTPRPGAGAVDAATGIARGAARTWVQTMMWGTRTSLRAARGLRVAATDREAAFESCKAPRPACVAGRATSSASRISTSGSASSACREPRRPTIAGTTAPSPTTCCERGARNCCESRRTSLRRTGSPGARARARRLAPTRPASSGCSLSRSPAGG